MKKILLLLVLLSHFIYAFSFSIDKPSFHIDTKSGASDKYVLQLKNNNDVPIIVNAYVQDWLYTKKGAKKFFVPVGRKGSCAGWIELETKKIEIPAKDRVNFFFKVHTPKSAVGGNHAVIFFETDLPAENQKGLKVGARIGSVVYQQTKGKTEHELVIIDKKVTNTGNNKIYYRFNVENRGNAWNSAKAIVSLVNNSEVLDQVFLGPKPLLPGDVYEFAGVFEGFEKGKVLISVEDYNENLVTDRAGADEVAADLNMKMNLSENQYAIEVKQYELSYKEQSKLITSKIILDTKGYDQPLKPILKIYDVKTKKRVKTLDYNKVSVNGDSARYALEWAAGEYLYKGKYKFVLTIDYLGQNIAREQELTIE